MRDTKTFHRELRNHDEPQFPTGDNPLGCFRCVCLCEPGNDFVESRANNHTDRIVVARRDHGAQGCCYHRRTEMRSRGFHPGRSGNVEGTEFPRLPGGPGIQGKARIRASWIPPCGPRISNSAPPTLGPFLGRNFWRPPTASRSTTPFRTLTTGTSTYIPIRSSPGGSGS